jgi:RNA polymerase primary sigma factor
MMAIIRQNKRSAAPAGRKAEENILSMYLREINSIPMLSHEEEDLTARAAAKGNKAAREKLITANLRFVVNIAKRYQGQGLALEDLISEGNIGLINAIERYDVNKGYHFISYAVWWIRQAILKAICEKARMIRLPLNRANELVQIEKVRQAFQYGSCKKGEIKEIARFLEMDANRVATLINIGKDTVSLERPVNPGKDASTVGDFIKDESHQSPDDFAIEISLESDIENVLSTLKEKEAEVIRYRFGLGHKEPLSLKEIGDKFNLTKERIRQIEKKAMKRLQHPSRKHILESYTA